MSVGGEVPGQPGNRISGTGTGLPANKDDQSVASESSGFGSLTKKRSGGTETVVGLVDDKVTDVGLGDPVIETIGGGGLDGVQPLNQMLSSTDHGHSRNSSNTSQVSQRGRKREKKGN